MEDQGRGTHVIELSVVIPTYNRADRLQVCLEALNRQTHPASEFEAVVVVDGSTDNTMQMLKAFEAPYLLRSIYQENSGEAAALNRGILEAMGSHVLFLDDDIVADPRLVAKHLQAHHDHPKAIVVGQITLSLPADAGWYARAFAQGWRDHYDRLNREQKEFTWEDCYSGNMSAPREALLTCGGFDVSIVRGFDVELARRLGEQGCSLIYRQEALGCQVEAKGFRQLSRDAESAGTADVLLYKEDHLRLSEALASFARGSWRKLLLRRLLLGLYIPPRWLEFLGRFIMSPSHRYYLHSLTQTLCYWRGVRQGAEKELWRQLTRGTPILMYHAIGIAHEPAGPYVMPVARFARQMKWLKRMGYVPITLGYFLACQRDRRPVPVGAVVITFDDGYRDNYTHAYPVLKQQNIPVTIFLVSGYIGRTNAWDEQKQLEGRPLMSWSQIQELVEQGVEFGAHTCTHPVLTGVSSGRAEKEIALSRRELQNELTVSVNYFAYPYGEHDASIEAMVQQSGFAAGLTVDAGLNTMFTPAYSLRRTEIYGTDSLLRFLLSLWMGDAEAFGWRRQRKQ
jgi:glycosyltransferase involved in cell wall biosynthesis/peptidoglycan/xylan/chitin deacetylase (PgdA/CDA1 family)